MKNARTRDGRGRVQRKIDAEHKIFAAADKAIAELQHPTELQTARGERLLATIQQANRLRKKMDAINDLDGDITPAMRRSEQAYIRRCMKGVPK
jgi:hypothetical protein